MYLALLVMTVMLGISLGLSSIFIGQTKMMKQIGNSVVALCAADAGIEKVLIDRANPNLTPDYYSGSFANTKITYQVLVVAGGTRQCPSGSNFCIKSIGSYLGTHRAVEIIY